MNSTLDISSEDEFNGDDESCENLPFGHGVWELLSADNDQGDNLTKNRMGTLTPPTGGPSGTRTIPDVESKYTTFSSEPAAISHGRCVSFNSEVSERSVIGDLLKPMKHEPDNSDSANQAASLRMQREKMLRSTLGDERYRIIEAIGAKDELIHSLFPVLTE